MNDLGNWPILNLECVYHIGELDPSKKGVRGPSYEGNGLSVSTNPEAWEEIAELGGLPWWRLECSGASFLDFHALSPDQKATIAAWGEAHGLVHSTTLWKVEYHDDEMETTMVKRFETGVEAREEAEYLEVDPPTSEEGFRCTEMLLERMGWSNALADALDGAAMAYAEDVLGVDGVWWQDDLAPELLSAPRGVIFRERLQLWSASIITDTTLML